MSIAKIIIIITKIPTFPTDFFPPFQRKKEYFHPCPAVSQGTGRPVCFWEPSHVEVPGSSLSHMWRHVAPLSSPLHLHLSQKTLFHLLQGDITSSAPPATAVLTEPGRNGSWNGGVEGEGPWFQSVLKTYKRNTTNSRDLWEWRKAGM